MINLDFGIELGPRSRRVLRRIARAIERQHEKRARQRFILIRLSLDTGQIIEGEINKMVITDTQQATLTFGLPLDKKGKPAKVQDGSVSFSIESGAGATVTQDPADPFSALVVAGDPTLEGSPATITISADADLGDGVRTITGVEPLIVIAGDAVGFGVATVGAPTEQP